jgi:hypothetical protein
MRRAPLIAAALTSLPALAALTAPAAADTFGGFSSSDRVYLVNQDKVCAPLPVEATAAAGVPRCDKAAADRLAQLSFKPATLQRGPKATFTAAASGRTLTISRTGGGEVVRWDALDPIGKVLEVHADHEERVAVVYQVRRLGRDMADVVAFELRKTGKGAQPGAAPSPGAAPAPGSSPDPAPAPADPALDKALGAARKTKGKAASAAWQRVLELSPSHPEALFRLAALAGKDRGVALSRLEQLATSPHPDAVEWRVAARLDPAFAALRADPSFRKAVGLDRPAGHPYEKVMGTGGVWEQSGTSCDSPTVAMSFTRERKFRLNVKSTCEGMVANAKFAGTWRIEGQGVVLALPNQGAKDDLVPCSFEKVADEEALRCPLDEDLQIFVLPARR